MACTIISSPTPTLEATHRAVIYPTYTAFPAPSAKAITPSPYPTLTQTPVPKIEIQPVYVFPIRPSYLASYIQGHHDYPAVDILVPSGSDFIAVTNGFVDWINYEDKWEPSSNEAVSRGGLSVAIIGDDGFRYYGSHLSSIHPNLMVGMRVRVGQILGYTGSSGNARGTPPQLHFGISYPTQADDWKVRRGMIDPYPYLRAWEKGISMTPDQ